MLQNLPLIFINTQLRASGPDQLVCARVSASASVSILVNASRAIDIYYVAHIDYIIHIGGLKPKEEGVIYQCPQLQQLQVGLEPRPHRGGGHQKCLVLCDRSSA